MERRSPLIKDVIFVQINCPKTALSVEKPMRYMQEIVAVDDTEYPNCQGRSALIPYTVTS
jgi:hypothetical protein